MTSNYLKNIVVKIFCFEKLSKNINMGRDFFLNMKAEFCVLLDAKKI